MSLLVYSLVHNASTCPAKIALDHLQSVLQAMLHVVQIRQHVSQSAIHALQLPHELRVELSRGVLLLQEAVQIEL